MSLPVLSEEKWQSLVEAAIANVFETMVHFAPAISKPFDLSVLDNPKELTFIGNVGFVGEINGGINIVMPQTLAVNTTNRMLGMDVSNLSNPENLGLVKDIVGELCNMVCGSVKNNLCDEGYPCMLGLPTIGHGNSLRICRVKQAVDSNYYVTHENQKMYVNLTLMN